MHFGPAIAELFQPCSTRLGIVEQVRNQHDEAALVDGLGEIAQRLGHVGVLPQREPLQRHESIVRCPARALAGSISRSARRTRSSPTASRCRFIRYARARRRDTSRTCSFVIALRPVAHRRAHIEQDVAIEVGLLLELLDEVAVGLARRPSSRASRDRRREMYCRYSANSTLKPLNGLRCRPVRKPSTIVRALRSSVPSRAITAGSRIACSRV